MGDSGSDSDAAEEEQGIAGELTREDVTTQPSRSNIAGSSSYDAQFTADNLEARGLDPQGFMSAENFAQTTQGGAGGDDTTSTAEDFIDSTGISVPTIQAAGTSPTFSGAGVSDVFDPMTMQAGSDTMVEALGAAPTTTQTRDLTPEQKTFAGLSDVLTRGLRDRAPEQTKQQRGLQAVAQTLGQAREKKALDPRGIDFGVTAPIESTVGDDFDPALDMADRSNMATGTTTGDAQFGVSPGRLQAEFGPRVASLAGGLDEQKTADIADLTNRPGIGTLLGLPSFARGAANFIGQKSRDRMAEAIARGKTDPLFGKGTDITDANLIRNEQGQVVGIRDNQGNLIEGMDPNAQMQQGDSEEVKKAPPKAPTDPCPEGYQLIDGKCTLMEKPVDEGTGFIRFPTDRDPPFQKGPFTPATVATDPKNIRPLNPVTFRLSDIFRT